MGVKAIRKEYDEGNISQKKLAIKYNVSPPSIRKIVLNLVWRHI